MKVQRFRNSRQKSQQRRARPHLEHLEDRVVLSLINHGGPVLASVQAQAVYLGSGWSSSSISSTQFNSFLSTTVNATSPYLAMLHNAGFSGVTGAGSTPTITGVTDTALGAVTSGSTTLTDAQIESYLQTAIDGGTAGTQSPNSNTLYVVFVEPNVVVDIGNGQNSTNAFLAYHTSFTDTNTGKLIRYAVVPFHGTAGNAQEPWLTSAFDSMTEAASHEIAEAVTDPDGTTYFDRSGNEVGDIVNGSTVYLNGYAVQREAAIVGSLANFLPMTPTGATAGHSVTFSIVAGALNVAETGGASFVAANPSGETGKVVAISTQGIDDFGQPMIDVVFSDGNAYEYHDFPANNPTAVANPSYFPWTSLGGNVKQAAAGQAVSYVLLTNGQMGEYVDPNYSSYYYGYGVNPGSRYGAIASGVSSITAAGVDQEGANAVEYTITSHGKTTTYEWRDVNGQGSTSTSGFKAASTHSEIVNGPFSSSLQGSSFQAALTDPAAQPAQAASSSSFSFVGVIRALANPATVAPAVVPIETPGGTVVPPPGQPNFAIPTQADRMSFPRLDSGSSGEDEDGSQDPRDLLDVSHLQDNLLPTAPRTQPGLPTDQFWATLDQTNFLSEAQAVSVTGDVWSTAGKQDPGAPVVTEKLAFSTMGAMALAFVMLGDRRSPAERGRRRHTVIL
jgi:hypothetical protein